MLVDTIRDLCRANNTNIKKIEVELGFANGSISRWCKSVPSADKVIKVANYFNVPIDYLLGAYGKTISVEAIELAKCYDNLPSDKKQAITVMLHTLSN